MIRIINSKCPVCHNQLNRIDFYIICANTNYCPYSISGAFNGLNIDIYSEHYSYSLQDNKHSESFSKIFIENLKGYYVLSKRNYIKDKRPLRPYLFKYHGTESSMIIYYKYFDFSKESFDAIKILL